MTFRLVRRTELSLGGRQCKKDYKPGVGTPAILLDIRDVGRALKSVDLEMMKLLENATGTSTYSGSGHSPENCTTLVPVSISYSRHRIVWAARLALIFYRPGGRGTLRGSRDSGRHRHTVDYANFSPR
jgi:hypothetical protein